MCTIRCFNTAAAGPFGGCIAVQQTDVKPNANTPDTIATAQTLEGVLAQVAQNQKDLPAAAQANKEAPSVDQQGVFFVDALLKIDSTASATGAVLASATTTAKATSTASTKNGKNKGKGARAFTA